jgi:multidrug resistance efflux pump
MEADKFEFEKQARGYRDEEKAMARNELAEAEALLRLAELRPLPQEIEQAQAAIEIANARIRRLKVMLQEATVRAPLDCVVEAFDLQPGDMVAPGAPLATLVRKDQLWVRAFSPETELGLLSENQEVAVTVDSFPNRGFPGVILRISRVGEFTPRNLQTYKERQGMMFGIKVRVQDEQQLLRPGMAATVHVPRMATASSPRQ